MDAALDVLSLPQFPEDNLQLAHNLIQPWYVATTIGEHAHVQLVLRRPIVQIYFALPFVVQHLLHFSA